jgi:hypothetical protein
MKDMHDSFMVYHTYIQTVPCLLALVNIAGIDECMHPHQQ